MKKLGPKKKDFLQQKDFALGMLDMCRRYKIGTPLTHYWSKILKEIKYYCKN